MKRTLVAIALVLIASAFLVSCREHKADATEVIAQQAPVVAGTYANDPVKRGQYLVRIGSCNDCHTPWTFDPDLGMPRPDMTRMLSGHPKDGPDPVSKLAQGDNAIIGPTFTSFALPFGVVYSANLTPDPESGLGSWTEEMFINALRNGRHLGGNGRGIYAPMPWFWIRNMSDDDMKAVFAYLKTVPPVHNVVPSPKVPEAAVAGLRDGFDQFASTLPREEWVPVMEVKPKAVPAK